MTERCVKLVKKFEGFSPVPYLCPAGYWTIGYGKVIGKEYKDIRVTEEEAEKMLIEDLLKVEKTIKPMIKVNIHEWMLDALISFSYNVGCWAFKVSTMRKKINESRLLDAADEFMKWIFAGGKPLAGLIRRRKAEKSLYLEGLQKI